MRNAWNNERGGVDPIIIMCASLIVMISFLLVVLDIWNIEQVDRKTTRVINELNKDIYSVLDVQYTAFQTGFKIESDAAAYELFHRGLQSRFRLDSTLSPISGSPFAGQVSIEDFRVLDETEVPYSDSYGRTMEYPGIIAIVNIPAKTPFLGLTNNQRVLITTEVYR